MSRIEGLSRERSPFLDRGGLQALFGEDGRPRVHADADALRAIRDNLRAIASRSYGKLFGHARLNELRRDVDHYLAVYVCGYEYAEGGFEDVGRSFPWRTGTGGYSGTEACRPWCEDLDAAVGLATGKCPALRLDVRFGGKGRGLRRARLSRAHPVDALAGREIALPDPVPPYFRDAPAAAVIYVLLEALALEKEAGYPYPAVSGRAAA